VGVSKLSISDRQKDEEATGRSFGQWRGKNVLVILGVPSGIAVSRALTTKDMVCVDLSVEDLQQQGRL